MRARKVDSNYTNITVPQELSLSLILQISSNSKILLLTNDNTLAYYLYDSTQDNNNVNSSDILLNK